jgi:hypothetical protein
VVTKDLPDGASYTAGQPVRELRSRVQELEARVVELEGRLEAAFQAEDGS